MGAVEVATPAALWGLLAGLPILAFHLYFRRRRRLFVPFAPLLVESAGLVRREARFKRLRETASLLLRLLALACAVLALGGLRPAEAVVPVRDLFVVLDGDVTTAAREADGALRLEHARRLAQQLVLAQPRGADAGDRTAGTVAAVFAGRVPRLLLAPTRERSVALDTLALPLLPESGRADLDAAVAMAVEAAARSDRADVVVLSARDVAEPPRPASVGWRVLGVGRARDDQGLVDLAVVRTPSGAAWRVDVQVRSDAEAPRERTLVASVGAREVAREPLALAPGELRRVTFDVPAPAEAAWLTLALEGADAYPANDVASVRLAPIPLPSLLVVHGGAVRPYTAAVVEALVAEGLVDPSRGGYVHARALADAEPPDVVLVDGAALPRAALRPGAYVFLAPLQGALPFDVGRAVRDPLVWRTARGHPLVEGLDLRRAFVVRGQALGGEGLVPLAWAEGEPVIGEGERDGMRYVALGLDPEGSALPVQVAWPRLVRSAVLRLARAPHVALAPFYRAGDALRPQAALPGGPDARVAWAGHEGDDVLAEAGRGVAPARLDPEGAAWPVPAGAVGRVRITTGANGPTPWTGTTAFLDLDPQRTIAPVRPAAAAPPAARARPATALRWRRGLLALAVLFLLLDLALLAHAWRTARA